MEPIGFRTACSDVLLRYTHDIDIVLALRGSRIRMTVPTALRQCILSGLLALVLRLEPGFFS